MAMGGGEDIEGSGDESRNPAIDEEHADLVRTLIGEVALGVAASAEGRAAGLSVEIWPDEGIWLRVRSGHELQLKIDRSADPALVRWIRRDPHKGEPRVTEGDLGPATVLTAEPVRTLVVRWLSWRAGER